MSKQYERKGIIMNEHDLLMDNLHKGRVSESVVKRAIKIARWRGMMEAYKQDGCWGSYDNLRLTLKNYLKNINKISMSGKPL